MDIVTHKVCSKCGIDKLAGEFHKRNNGNRLQPQCKVCRKRGKPPEPITATKVCSKCGKEFPRTREYFWHSNSNTDGLYGYCIDCAKKKASDYYQDNKTECNKRTIDWMKRHPDKVKVAKKKCRKPDPIGQKKRGKKWRDKHPEKTRMYTAERRARLRNAEGYHTDYDLKLQFDKQDGKCYWCGNVLEKGWHEDHIKPLKRGGSNWPENLVCSCAHCNCSRQHKLPEEWLQLSDHLTIDG